MIHIGVAGCGKIAQVRHLPEYHDREDVCVWGLYDLNPDRTETRVFTRSTLMPDRRAARSLEPMAYTWRPNGVRRATTIRTAAMISQ